MFLHKVSKVFSWLKHVLHYFSLSNFSLLFSWNWTTNSWKSTQAKFLQNTKTWTYFNTQVFFSNVMILLGLSFRIYKKIGMRSIRSKCFDPAQWVTLYKKRLWKYPNWYKAKARFYTCETKNLPYNFEIAHLPL